MKPNYTNYVIETNCPDYSACPFDYYCNARFASLALLAAGFTVTLYRREHYGNDDVVKVPMPISQNTITQFKHRISDYKDYFDILNIPNFYETHFDNNQH